jgi:hypothetical protein
MGGRQRTAGDPRGSDRTVARHPNGLVAFVPARGALMVWIVGLGGVAMRPWSGRLSASADRASWRNLIGALDNLLRKAFSDQHGNEGDTWWIRVRCCGRFGRQLGVAAV